MIISRTPYRVSFFGGGTDYPEWYNTYGGSVLSTTIDKYSYITCKNLPPFFDYKYRIRYYQREEVNFVKEIRHPSIREALKYFKVSDGLDIVHHGDLPAQSGLGTSSTFTVGLLHALYALKDKNPSKSELAHLALYIEQKMIGEHVGSQDQVAAAYGGLNHITFNAENKINVNPINLSEEMSNELENSLLLFFTGFTINSSDYSKNQIDSIDNNYKKLISMNEVVKHAVELLTSQEDRIKLIGKLLDEQWKIKKSLNSEISNNKINDIYVAGISAGAWGGKLLGAGGGGFMLFVAPTEKHHKIKEKLKKILHVPVKFENNGSQIIYKHS